MGTPSFLCYCVTPMHHRLSVGCDAFLWCPCLTAAGAAWPIPRFVCGLCYLTYHPCSDRFTWDWVRVLSTFESVTDRLLMARSAPRSCLCILGPLTLLHVIPYPACLQASAFIEPCMGEQVRIYLFCCIKLGGGTHKQPFLSG